MKMFDPTKYRPPMYHPIYDLDQLIRERLNERRRSIRDKLERDAGIIAARNNKFHVFVNSYFKDKKQRSLEELNDPADISFVLVKYPIFDKLLEEKRILAWLPEVLQLLRRGGYVYKWDWKRKQRINCLGLRGVSKSFKEIADSQLFESSFLDPLWYMHIDYATDWREELSRDASHFPHWNETNADVTVFKHTRHFDGALESFPQQADVSPSIFRKLVVRHKMKRRGLQLADDGNMEQKLIQFLDIHGSSVWFFVYKPKVIPMEAGHQHIYELVSRMPNLKGLVMSFNKLDDTTDLLSGITLETFRHNASLQFIKCDPNNSKLDLFRLAGEPLSLKVLKMDKFQRKEVVGIEVEGYSHDLYDIFCTIAISPKPPLKSLTLESSAHGGGKPVYLSHWWRFLNHFGDTLTDLSFYANIKDNTEDNNSNVELDLPHLRRLKLWVNTFGRRDSLLTFDDLARLKSLEKVRIQMKWEFYQKSRLRRFKRKEYVEIEGFHRKLHHSNIWNIFPNLKEIEFRDTWWDKIPARPGTTYGFDPGCLRSRRSGGEVRYVKSGNTITRFQARKLRSGFKQTSYQIDNPSSSRYSII